MEHIHLNLNRSILLLIVACTALVGCASNSGGTSGSSATPAAATGSSKDTGRLVIVRVANMGEDLAVSLKIDGSPVADIIENNRYDAPLAVGAHVLTVGVSPNRSATPLTQTRVMVVKGQTYTFTAMWKGQKLVLVSN